MTTNHDIDWIDGQPYSRLFGDIFFSRESGLEETRHVFLDGNSLRPRWQTQGAGETFVIGETGFGTGLNFLATWQAWNQIGSRGRLHFFSCEKYPLSVHALETTHGLWPELSALSALLRAQYGEPSPGWHRLIFQEGRVALTLVIGDARECLPLMNARAHAWFLDGFAPARNPELWDLTVLKQIARLSHSNATFATYTCAGEVRRALQLVGFTVAKKPGFGRKREMLVGTSPDRSRVPRRTGEKQAIVLGGGISGCSTSRSLAERGWQVTLLERNPRLADGASGIPQATLNLRLRKRMLAAHLLALVGYQFSIRLCNRLLSDTQFDWQQCGTLQLDHASRRIVDSSVLTSLGLPPGLAQRLSQIEAGELCGLPVSSGGFYFPRGGCLHGPTLCQRLTAHDLIHMRFSTEITDVQWSQGEAGWHAADRNGETHYAAVVVVANAQNATLLPSLNQLPLHRVGGQITLIPATNQSMKLRTVLCGEGVITPARDGVHTVGATYNHAREDDRPSEKEDEANLQMLSHLAPALYSALGLNTHPTLGNRVAFRSTSPDRTPLAGAMDCGLASGLWVNLAHGSRGFSTGPLLGEFIASAIEGEPSPLPDDLARSIDPNRFR